MSADDPIDSWGGNARDAAVLEDGVSDSEDDMNNASVQDAAATQAEDQPRAVSTISHVPPVAENTVLAKSSPQLLSRQLTTHQH